MNIMHVITLNAKISHLLYCITKYLVVYRMESYILAMSYSIVGFYKFVASKELFHEI